MTLYILSNFLQIQSHFMYPGVFLLLVMLIKPSLYKASLQWPTCSSTWMKYSLEIITHSVQTATIQAAKSQAKSDIKKPKGHQAEVKALIIISPGQYFN